MAGLDNLEILFVMSALLFQIVLIIADGYIRHFALRKWALASLCAMDGSCTD